MSDGDYQIIADELDREKTNSAYNELQALIQLGSEVMMWTEQIPHDATLGEKIRTIVNNINIIKQIETKN